MKKYILISLTLIYGCKTIQKNHNDFSEDQRIAEEKVLLKDEVIKYQTTVDRIIDSLIGLNDPRLKKDKNNNIIRPNDISPSGKPLYFETTHGDNLFSSIKAETVKTGGSLGLNLFGNGVTVGIWDYGAILSNHIEFINSTIGGSAIEIDENESQEVVDNHPTNVTSCIYAQGIYHTDEYDFQGLAPNVDKLIYRDWDNRDLEIIIALDGNSDFVLSNHSYGFPIKNSSGNYQYDASEIGIYGGRDKILDKNANTYPYYLHVTSAGNEGDLGEYAEGTGLQYAGQEFNKYDLLTNGTLAKNILTVGAISNETSLFGTALPSAFSSSGPADDGRIKPEIVARGERVPVARALNQDGNESTDSYGLSSGTSFSSPITTGGLVLLQELYKNYNQTFMLSATLKGLACHTADDIKHWNGFKDILGPDPKTGYGVLNLEKAATLIMNDSANNTNLQELELNDGEELSFSYTLTDSSVPFIASISWTDPAKENLSAAVDLVNDLDIRVEKDGEIYYPWKLDANAKNQAATKGDNIVDNLEKVNVVTETGTYTITISHKGTLDAVQKVSLIVSGGGFLTLGNEKLETIELVNTVLAYHNLVKDVITIKSLDPSNAINNIRIFDINSRMLANKRQTSQQLIEIDASALNSGIYFLNIQTEKGTLSIKTLVK